MKNQYFGDENDYRKYGLLRLLGGDGEIHIGVCWMLTPDDEGPDGGKTEYLQDDKEAAYRHYDPTLYDFLKLRVHGHEIEKASRNVEYFDATRLQHGRFWDQIVQDAVDDRQQYFDAMWTSFGERDIQLIFFDPDDGLANNHNPQHPLQSGHNNSAKKLFRDEVTASLDKGFSVLFYQHFDRTPRGELVAQLGVELAGMTNAATGYSFWTPHVVFFLVPHSNHSNELADAVGRVEASDWTANLSARTSRTNGQRQITVTQHEALGEATA